MCSVIGGGSPPSTSPPARFPAMSVDLTLTLAAPNPECIRSPREPHRPTDISGDLAPPTPGEKKEKKKIRPETPLYNVKELLSTGLLEGIPISYVSTAGEVLLEGVVKDLGYQCGCGDCNNAVVLCASTFEKHANVTTNNPNNRVCFKSGISIYNLVKVLENHRLGSLDKVIEDKVGCPVNMKRFEDWKASFEKGGKGVQKTRRSVELPQTQTGVQHQRTSANDFENVQIQQELHSEPCLDKIVGVENSQTNTWLQLQTPCEKNYGDLPTQQEALTEPCPDKINGERLQNQNGLKLPTACAIGHGIGHTQPGLNTELHSDKISVESLQSLRGLQHQRERANDYESLPTQPGLHTEPCSDRRGNDVESPQAQGLLLRGACANGYEPMETLPGPHTEPYSGERNGVQNVHARTGVQLQRARANSYPAIHTQPGAHSKPYSNERSQGLAVGHSTLGTNEFSSYEPASLVGSPHLVPVISKKFSPRGPSEDGMDATPSILTPVVQEKRFMLQDKLKRENRSSYTPNIACSPKSDVGTLQRKVYSRVHGRKRDMDLHRLIFMENGLPDGTELEYRQKGEVKLRGMKRGMGILCNCCNETVSPSKFELHAGFKEKRQPYKHIYKDGMTLHDMCLSMWNDQSLSTCVGDLIPCGQCQKAFHAASLKLNCRPDDKLHCPDCATKITSSSATKPKSSLLRRIFKDTLDELGTGCVLCKTKDFSDADDIKNDTLIICNQCEREYHVGCLKHRGICDLKEYAGQWYCCLECDLIRAALRSLVFHGPKLVPESLLGFLKKNEEENVTSELGVAVQWQLLGGKYQYTELFNQVAVIFQDAFDPIMKRDIDLMTGMILGKEAWAGEYFDGMFCAVLRIESVIISAGILRVFGRGLAELPLVATSIGSRGKGYFRTLLSVIEWLLSRLKVEVLVLPVACEEETMWINKLGFTKMTEERWIKYASEYPLLSFEKMTVLEKAVPCSLNDEGRDDLLPFTFSENFTGAI